MKVGIVVYDGFDELDAIGPYEVLRNAAAGGANIEMKLVTLHAATSVRGSHGLVVAPEGVISEGFDWLLVAGGAWISRASVGAWGEIQRGDLPRALAAAFAAGTRMAAVCTGAMLLSAGGILRGRPSVTHHRAIDALRAEGANVVQARVVDDGNLITAGGVTSGIDLALWMVERFFGRTLADGIATTMEYQRTRDIRTEPELPTPRERLAATPEPPYYAVIFARIRRSGDEGYGVMASRMLELVGKQPGFLGFEDASEQDGTGITVSYWESLDAIRNWKQQLEHLEAQRQGREAWYAAFELRIAKVERAYRFARES